MSVMLHVVLLNHNHQDSKIVVGNFNELRIYSKLILGVEHPQGKGRLITAACPVVFEIIIPKDLAITPYIALISTGSHSHIPPPPNVVSINDLSEIKQVLRTMLTPGLTTST